jgi:hypothetical protein
MKSVLFTVCEVLLLLVAADMVVHLWLDRASDGAAQAAAQQRQPANIKQETTPSNDTAPPADDFSRASEIITEECSRRWPDKPDMQTSCQTQQLEGLAQLQKAPPSGIDPADIQVVRTECRRRYAKEFSTWAFCEAKQFEAIRKLQARTPEGLDAADFQAIRADCVKHFPTDFSTRAFCEEQALQKMKQRASIQYDLLSFQTTWKIADAFGRVEKVWVPELQFIIKNNGKIDIDSMYFKAVFVDADGIIVGEEPIIDVTNIPAGRGRGPVFLHGSIGYTSDWGFLAMCDDSKKWSFDLFEGSSYDGPWKKIRTGKVSTPYAYNAISCTPDVKTPRPTDAQTSHPPAKIPQRLVPPSEAPSKTPPRAAQLPPATETELPDGVVRQYYAALNRHDVEGARGKWKTPPSRLQAVVQQVDWYRIEDMKLLRSEPSTAQVEVVITAKRLNQQPAQWRGTIELEKMAGLWKIATTHLTKSTLLKP